MSTDGEGVVNPHPYNAITPEQMKTWRAKGVRVHHGIANQQKGIGEYEDCQRTNTTHP